MLLLLLLFLASFINIVGTFYAHHNASNAQSESNFPFFWTLIYLFVYLSLFNIISSGHLDSIEEEEEEGKEDEEKDGVEGEVK